jgi:hypothetical protein
MAIKRARPGGTKKNTKQSTKKGTTGKKALNERCVECDDESWICGQNPDCDDIELMGLNWEDKGTYEGDSPARVQAARKGNRIYVRLIPD